MATKKNLNYYVNLKWSYTLEEDEANDKRFFIIRVNELPGVCTDAETVEEGMREIKDAIKAAIKLYMKQGESIPEPIDKDQFKGQIAYRTSSERHYHLAKAARQLHKSLSKTLDLVVDAGIRELRIGL
jgi:predicted RNase H-like HicB family nuclease